MRYRPGVLAFAILVAAAGTAGAQGLVIPNEPDLPPLALWRHNVRIEIDQQTAVTTVEQVFQNNTERQLEAQYVFPVPRGAVVTRFTMIVNGKEQQGELVEKAKARQVYNQIVNRAQDPGLLEYLGNDLFRANIFPILPRGTQTVTVTIQQVLTAEGSLVQYSYPIRSGGKRGPTVQGQFSLEAKVKSPVPILNVYSPSHAVNILRPGEREAQVTTSSRGATLERDFQLYYSVSEKELGLNLVACRPDPAQPGYFMLLASPKSRQPKRVVDRDVIFVVDTSGSMSGDKFKQAMNALRYCITKLNDGDRFGLVRFSTYVDTWKSELVPAAENRKAALAWVDTLLAEGGTDIAGALDAALAFPRDPKRPAFVVFMTDGKPTIGQTIDPRQILGKVEQARSKPGSDSMRIFTWGVGYDVDTALLDGIASLAGGVSEYVRPEEDIEVKVSSFYNKASSPLLTNLELKAIGDKVQLVNVQPRALPDLYAGSQLVVLGRYTGEGHVALQLTGRVNDQSETFTYEANFPAREARHAFLEPLWAKRRIGELLDTIRLRGETKELVDDVIRLSREYGIQTPYTSYLILEDGRQVAAAPQPGTAGQFGLGGAGPSGGRPATAPPATKAEADRDLRQRLDDLARRGAGDKPANDPGGGGLPGEEKRKEHNESAKELAEGFYKKDGKSGVDAAAYLKKLKEAEHAGEAQRVTTFKKAAGTRFFLYREMWVDERFESAFAVTTVKFGSEAYFRLIELKPEIVEALKVGTSVVLVTAPGKALVVAEKGEEKLTDEQIAELFAAKK